VIDNTNSAGSAHGGSVYHAAVEWKGTRVAACSIRVLLVDGCNAASIDHAFRCKRQGCAQLFAAAVRS
jgi:hypothetical protein